MHRNKFVTVDCYRACHQEWYHQACLLDIWWKGRQVPDCFVLCPFFNLIWVAMIMQYKSDKKTFIEQRWGLDIGSVVFEYIFILLDPDSHQFSERSPPGNLVRRPIFALPRIWEKTKISENKFVFFKNPLIFRVHCSQYEA